MELWASPEPTIVRLNRDRYRDQRAETGHLARIEDVERLTSLGIAATRYPVLWESVAPLHPLGRDYTWEARRLERLAVHGVEPIVTLLHHGSGPRYTSLIDERFPELFADYAEATARRFPWIERWTPINEPLTTARFSTLYGAWFPNLCDERAFGRALVNQMLGFALAAERIAGINPRATFMLTEDLQSFTAADAGVRAYAAHKGERAYLSIDLLCGNVAPGHALWDYLVETCAVPAQRLETMRRFARPPDLLGWNYYRNSERHLATNPGGAAHNIPLFDVHPTRLDPRPLLRAASRRFGLPLALSEVHLYGTERERASWLLERYADAVALRAEGVDIRAVGAWAAFGMVDWTSLLRERRGHIEDGLYTCVPSDRAPQATLVADVLRSLCRQNPREVAVTAPPRNESSRAYRS